MVAPLFIAQTAGMIASVSFFVQYVPAEGRNRPLTLRQLFLPLSCYLRKYF